MSVGSEELTGVDFRWRARSPRECPARCWAPMRGDDGRQPAAGDEPAIGIGSERVGRRADRERRPIRISQRATRSASSRADRGRRSPSTKPRVRRAAGHRSTAPTSPRLILQASAGVDHRGPGDVRNGRGQAPRPRRFRFSRCRSIRISRPMSRPTRRFTTTGASRSAGINGPRAPEGASRSYTGWR